jgi:ABC-2 type transport system ATP-binding protein
MKLVAEDLAKTYGRVEAVRGVSFAVAGGEILGLLGPNGAGKTTTVETLLGLTVPDRGRVEVCGIDARRQPRLARSRMGSALQFTGLQPKVTPREAVAVFAALSGRAAAPAGLLDEMGLAEKADQRFETLSGGQRQRLALALALVNDPEVVLLDEPTAGLDVQGRRALHERIRALAQDGRAVLVTTHDMEEAEQLCHRVLVMDQGRIVAEGAPAALIAGSRARITVRLQTSAPLPAGCAPPAGVEAVAIQADGLQFQTTDLNRALAQTSAWLTGLGIQITGVRAGPATLEEIVLELTTANEA